jgi:hypothetical protein
MEHVVKPFVSLRSLEGEHVQRLLNHAQERAVAL